MSRVIFQLTLLTKRGGLHQNIHLDIRFFFAPNTQIKNNKITFKYNSRENNNKTYSYFIISFETH